MTNKIAFCCDLPDDATMDELSAFSDKVSHAMKDAMGDRFGQRLCRVTVTGDDTVDVGF